MRGGVMLRAVNIDDEQHFYYAREAPAKSAVLRRAMREAARGKIGRQDDDAR